MTGLEFSSSLITKYSEEERGSRRGEVEESQGELKVPVRPGSCHRQPMRIARGGLPCLKFP